MNMSEQEYKNMIENADLRRSKQDDPELERLIKIRNKYRNQIISDIKQGKLSKSKVIKQKAK